VVPGVHNTAPNMFAFGGGLLDAGRLPDIDRKLSFRPATWMESVCFDQRSDIIKREKWKLRSNKLSVINVPGRLPVRQSHVCRASDTEPWTEDR
jgi:hypothetical protein